jgi:hypothetical protein
MISPRKNQWSLVLVLALIGSMAWAAEPNEIPIHLEFEISPTPLGPYAQPRADSVLYPLASRRPAYAAAIPLVPPLDWLPSPARHTMDNFVGNTKSRSPDFGYAYQPEAGLSEPQKAFLQAAKGLLNGPDTGLLMHRPDPNAPLQVLLYALTLEDAKQMARAYFRYARNDWWRGYVTGLNDETVPGWAQRVAQEEARAAELDQGLATARKALEDLVKTVPYRTEAEAHEAIGELDRMLNAAQVEIAGIKARIMAIQGYQRGVQYQETKGANGETVRVAVAHEKASPEAAPKLDILFIEESIALRGAQAREQMATRLREQANRYLDLKSTLTSAAAERKTLGENLDMHRQELAGRRQDLEAAMQQEPKIPAKIVIYPVQWANEPSPN